MRVRRVMNWGDLDSARVSATDDSLASRNSRNERARP
jgi:hypothetical protein